MGNHGIGFIYLGAITGTADILSNRTAVTTDAPFGTFVGYRVALLITFDWRKLIYKRRKNCVFSPQKDLVYMEIVTGRFKHSL